MKEVELIAVSKDDPFVAFAFEQMGKDCGEPNWSWEHAAAVAQFTEYFNRWQAAQQQKQQGLNELGRQDYLRKEIRGAVNVIVNQIIGRCSKARSEVSPLTRQVYEILRRHCGSYVPEANSDQLEADWEYLITLQDEIRAGRIPEWAR